MSAPPHNIASTPPAPISRCRGRFFIALALAMLGLAMVTVWADSVDEIKVAKVKSAYLLNFLKFTTWPQERFKDTTSPIVVTVVGTDTLGDALDHTMMGKKISGRPIEVRRVPAAPDPTGEDAADTPPSPEESDFFQEIKKSHLLFISADQEHRLRNIFAWIKGRDVLTVGDTTDFAQRGGMIGLVVRNRRLVFDANPEAVKQTRVVLSSKVLKLARIVQTRQE